MTAGYSLSPRQLSFYHCITLKHEASLPQMLLLGWPYSVADLPSYSLACGNSLRAMSLVLQVSGVSEAAFCQFLLVLQILTLIFLSLAFTSYGAFWMSYATILIPGSGIIEAFKDPAELDSALGIFLIAWFMVTFLLL